MDERFLGFNLQHERTSFSIIFCLYDVLSFTFLYLLINIIFPLLIISWKYRILSLDLQDSEPVHPLFGSLLSILPYVNSSLQYSFHLLVFKYWISSFEAHFQVLPTYFYLPDHLTVILSRSFQNHFLLSYL